MALKIDLLLRQLKGLEEYLEQGRSDDARNAIAGLRLVLLSEDIDKEQVAHGTAYQDSAWFYDKLERARKLEGKVSNDPYPLCQTFTEEITCWGWYDVQVDSAGRDYRWCGGEQEAGLRLAFDESLHAGLVLAIRPFKPEDFNRNTLEMHVNGAPTPFEILSETGAKIVELGIVPPKSRNDNTIDITFYLKGVTASTSSKERNLIFNLFEIVLIPNSV